LDSYKHYNKWILLTQAQNPHKNGGFAST
jgi:hypothetical protein